MSRRSAARRSRRWTHYIAGYQAGAKKANPGIKTLNGYSQDFVDQAKCKEIALDQIAQGSKVVFQVAGQCGLGALDAAKEKGVQGIGVDADQALPRRPHPHQRPEEGRRGRVRRRSSASRTATFKGGADVIATVKNGGVGLGKIGAGGRTKYARADRGDHRTRSPPARSRTSPTTVK